MFQTILDPNEVFAVQEAAPEYRFVRRGGCLLQCGGTEDNLYIERIISTNPADYLDPAYQPGARFGEKQDIAAE